MKYIIHAKRVSNTNNKAMQKSGRIKKLNCKKIFELPKFNIFKRAIRKRRENLYYFHT